MPSHLSKTCCYLGSLLLFWISRRSATGVPPFFWPVPPPSGVRILTRELRPRPSLRLTPRIPLAASGLLDARENYFWDGARDDWTCNKMWSRDSLEEQGSRDKYRGRKAIWIMAAESLIFSENFINCRGTTRALRAQPLPLGPLFFPDRVG